jgi:hypothetical protein
MAESVAPKNKVGFTTNPRSILNVKIKGNDHEENKEEIAFRGTRLVAEDGPNEDSLVWAEVVNNISLK